MQLISLNLDNFRQHKATALEFLPGVTGIIGKNGSGKTTILEAIAWALYGSAAVRGKNETIRCRAAEGNSPVEVKLVFGIGPHNYRVTRRLDSSGKSSASLSIDGVASYSGFKDVTEAVTKLLGMDYQAFFTSFFTAQKELDFMRGMDGPRRAAAVSRMLGYERLLKARDRANQDRLGLQREMDGLERGLGDPEEMKQRKEMARTAVTVADKSLQTALEVEKSARNDVDRLKPSKELSEQKSKRADELFRRIELDKADHDRAAQRVKELASELSDIEAKEHKLHSLAPQLEEFREAEKEYHALEELQKHEARRSAIEGRLAQLSGDEQSLHSRIEQIAIAPDSMMEIERQLADLVKQIEEVGAQIEGERNRLSSARHRAEAELDQLTAQKNEILEKRSAICDAGPSGKCPTCERPLADELPKVIAGFDSHIQKLDSRIDKLRKTIADLEKEPESLLGLSTLRKTLETRREDGSARRAAAVLQQSELLRCQNELSEKQKAVAQLTKELNSLPSGFSQERYNLLRETGKKLRPVRDASIALKAAVDRRVGVETDLARERESVRRARSDAEQSNASLKELGFSQEEYEKLISDFNAATALLNSASLEAERARGDLKAAQAALTAAENDEKSYKSKEADLREKRRARLHLQTLAETFDNLRNDLNSRTAPELAAAASELLSDMTDGRYSTLDIDEDYEAIIRDDGEPKPVISGGEDDIVNLALRLAVSRMIADRAGQDLSLLVLDEVFGSLDDIRRDNVITLLQTLKARFEQIILITHVEAIHDAVDNCIWVDYDESTKLSQVKTKIDTEE